MPGPHDARADHRCDRQPQSPGRTGGERHAADEECKGGLQRHHQLHPGAPVGEVRPHEAQDVGEGRRPCDEGHRDVHPEGGGGGGEVLLHENRRGGPFNEAQGQPEEPPGQDLAAEDAFRQGTRLDGSALTHGGEA